MQFLTTIPRFQSCLKVFSDKKSMDQHDSYHKRVQDLIANKEITLHDPELMLPQAVEDVDDSAVPEG